VLTDESGKNTFIDTQKTKRFDVGKYFKRRRLNYSGYTSTADVSSIKGNYTLGLALVEGEHIRICPKWSIPGTFKGIASERIR
jgi:hypothetical protein